MGQSACFHRSDLWASTADLTELAEEAYNTVKNQFPNDPRFASERSHKGHRRSLRDTITNLKRNSDSESNKALTRSNTGQSISSSTSQIYERQKSSDLPC